MFGLSIRLCLAITLAVCLSVTTDAKPNTDHASSIVPEEELSLVGGAENIWDDCDTSVSCQASIKEAVGEELKHLKRASMGSDMYPTSEQMDSISGVSDQIGLLTNFISAAKDANSNPSAFYGQELQLISEVAAIVPLEPFSGFMSLVAGIGAAFFLSDKAPKPPPLSLGDIQTAVEAALAKFQINAEIDTINLTINPSGLEIGTNILTMLAAVGTRYDDLRLFGNGTCCLVNSATCPAESDECTTADSCTSKDNNPYSKSFGTSAKVNTEACCKFYEGMCEWTRPQGPTSPVNDANAKQLLDTLINGTKDICGSGSDSAVTLLDRLADTTFGPMGVMDGLKTSPQFNTVPITGTQPSGTPYSDECSTPLCQVCACNDQCTYPDLVNMNTVPEYWAIIKPAAHAWLLGYYTLLQYGSAVFKTISVNSNNQAFQNEYGASPETYEGADIFRLYHENFVTDCAMKDKAKLAKSLQKLLTYMGPEPMPTKHYQNQCITGGRNASQGYGIVGFCASQACKDAFFGVDFITP